LPLLDLLSIGLIESEKNREVLRSMWFSRESM